MTPREKFNLGNGYEDGHAQTTPAKPNLWQSPPLIVACTLSMHKRYLWRAQHSVTVWFHPTRDEINEWHACLADRSTEVTADSEDGAELVLCDKFNITHWRDAK